MVYIVNAQMCVYDICWRYFVNICSMIAKNESHSDIKCDDASVPPTLPM